MSSATISKSERIDVRATLPVKQLLQEAARAGHKNVSEFLLDSGVVAANQILADRLRFELPPEKWEAFQAALAGAQGDQAAGEGGRDFPEGGCDRAAGGHAGARAE